MNVEASGRSSPVRQTSMLSSLHDDFGLNQPNVMNAIDSRSLERDACGKPVSPFPHPVRAACGHHEIGHGPFGRRLEALPFELTFLSAYGAPPGR
jgi:hypothetical protein